MVTQYLPIKLSHVLTLSCLFTLSIVCSGQLQAQFGKHDKKHYSEVEKEAKIQKRRVKKIKVQPINIAFPEHESIIQSLEQGAVETHLGAHVDQTVLESLPVSEAYETAFEEGDELFEIEYNAIDGAGANIGNGKRFSTIPRLDLKKSKAWAKHLPHRTTGPNGTSCIGCHSSPVPDGAGGINSNTVRITPDRSQKGFIERQAPHMHGLGALQLLAEEMTTDLQQLRDQAIAESCDTQQIVRVRMQSKDIDFGSLRADCDTVFYRNLQGVDNDLIVKPFEWKGLTASVRAFTRGAANQELGLQSTELVGSNDNDFDGVVEELSVGDITALSIYSAAQPRPVTKLELNQLADQGEFQPETLEKYGLPLTQTDIQSIQRGEQVFENMNCGQCHASSLTLNSTVYYEPSNHTDFKDTVFPAGSSIALPKTQIQFDLTSDIGDNPYLLPSGQTLGQFEQTEDTKALVRLYGDLKRHNMGPKLAEEVDEGQLGHSTFMTENLWGVGSTPPYLHDGRATTLTEAILLHGGDAQDSQESFQNASTTDQQDLIKFLDNLVLFLNED